LELDPFATKNVIHRAAHACVRDKLRRELLGLVVQALGLYREREATMKGTRMSHAFTGGCSCGQVRFRATRAPVRTLVCHCTFCQRLTGSSSYAASILQRLDALGAIGRGFA
jgi:hypothetical protein